MRRRMVKMPLVAPDGRHYPTLRGGMTRSEAYERVIARIATERVRQDVKWGDQVGHTDPYWLGILVEEVGETAKAIIDGSSLDEIGAELLHVAAVAVQWL